MDTLFSYDISNYTTIKFKEFSLIDGPIPNKSKFLHYEFDSFSEEEDEFVKNYGNPLAKVIKEYAKLIVQADENKVSLKIFRGSRLRIQGKVFFKVNKHCDFLTVNRKTGDVYTGSIDNYQKKKSSSKSFQKNSFLFASTTKFFEFLKKVCKPQQHLDAQFQYFEALKIFRRELNLDKYSLGVENISDCLVRNYFDHKKIKYSDNVSVFIKNGVKLKVKQMRLFDSKFVETYMFENDLQGGVIKKALHNCKRLNIALLKYTLNFFGKDWVLQDYDFVLSCLNSKGIYVNTWWDHRDIPKIFSTIFSKLERKRVFKFFRNYVLMEPICDFHTFNDHIRMISELRNLGEHDVSWKTESPSDFADEHFTLVSKLDYYKKGYYKRIYPEYPFRELDTPIKCDGNVYYPVLLTTTDDYIDESSVQSNCVKGYIGNPGSYIVSLRKGSPNSKERATIEFFICKDNNGKIVYKVRQALGRFNEKLDDKVWSDPLTYLGIKFNRILNSKFFEPVKIEKEFKNGKKLVSDTYWDDDGHMKWSSVDITSYYD